MNKQLKEISKEYDKQIKLTNFELDMNDDIPTEEMKKVAKAMKALKDANALELGMEDKLTAKITALFINENKKLLKLCKNDNFMIYECIKPALETAGLDTNIFKNTDSEVRVETAELLNIYQYGLTR